MIVEILNQKLEETGMVYSNRQDGSPDVIAKENTSKTIIVPENLRTDIDALKKYIGHDLYTGLCITVSLKELCGICPRTRRKTDAYSRLVGFLKDEMKVTLTITSQKSKKL